MWQTYLQPTSLTETLTLLHQHAGQARLVAGGTDVLVELQRGVQPTSTLIDITALPDLKYVRYENDWLYLGALATHNDVIASPECVQHALPLAQACWEVGAPQIRTRATIAGNLITPHPPTTPFRLLWHWAQRSCLSTARVSALCPYANSTWAFDAPYANPTSYYAKFAFPLCWPTSAACSLS